MSTRLTPRNGRESRGHYRENSIERKSRGGGKSKSPRRESSSRSHSPRRSDRRHIKNRSSRESRSPRRKERRHKADRSPSRERSSQRKERRHKADRSPSKERSCRSVRRSRRTERRDERNGRSRKQRRHRRNRNTSASRSPVRRSRRRRDYSSSNSSSNSSSSETEYHHRRRRKRRKDRRKRPILFRVGDVVEFKKSSRRRRRSKWVPVEICKVHRDGMYGEITYDVWLFHSRRVVDYVHTDELRFKHDDLERRRRHDERACYRENLRRGEYYNRGQRMGRVRERSYVRTGYPRAQSAERNRNILASHVNHQQRGRSVPPENENWGAFLADFAKAVYRDKGGDRDFSNRTQWQTAADEIGSPVRRFPHNDKHFDEIEHSHRHWEDNYRFVDGNRDISTDEYTNFQGERRRLPNDGDIGVKRGAYNIKRRDGQGRDINLNVNLPVMPACHCKKDGGIKVESN